MANQLPPMLDPFAIAREEKQRASQEYIAGREAQQRVALNQLLSRNVDPRTGQINFPAVYSGLAQQQMGELVPDLQAEEAKLRQQRGVGLETEAKGLVGRMSALKGQVPNNPAAARVWVGRTFDDPDVGDLMQQFGTREEAMASVPDDPAQFQEWRRNAVLFADEVIKHEMALEMEEAKRRATPSAPREYTPTLSEVVDPNDPTRMLRVDAKRYRGGSIGSPGVLGISGKMPATEEVLDMKERKKRDASFSQASNALRNYESKTDELIKNLRALRNHPGLKGLTGPLESRLPTVRKETAQAEAIYENIMAQGQFRELQAMRDASPTGGALGNISNFEIQVLRDSFAPLRTVQDEQSFKAGIDELVDKLENAKRGVRTAYDETYSYRTQGAAAAPAAPAAGGGAQPAQPAPTRVNSKADLDRLPSGALYVGPDGKTRRKP